MKNPTLVLLLFSLLFTAAPVASASQWLREENARRMLERFEGDWSGYYTVSTPTGHLITRIDVEQSYRLNKEKPGQLVLRGWAAYTTGGQLSHARSETTRDKAELKAVIVHDNDREENFIGVVRDNGVTWTPKEEGPDKSREVTEMILSDDTGPYIRIKGYERIRFDGKEHVVVIVGMLRKKPKEENNGVSGEAAPSGVISK
jgi:hypothetical protein